MTDTTRKTSTQPKRAPKQTSGVLKGITTKTGNNTNITSEPNSGAEVSLPDDSNGQGVTAQTEFIRYPIQKSESSSEFKSASLLTAYSQDTVKKTYVLKCDGHRIRLTDVGLQLASYKKGNRATAKVTYQVNGGTEVTLKEWIEVQTDYQEKIQALNKTFLQGKDVIIRFHLKTNNKSVKALMQHPYVKYEIVE